MSRRSNPLQLRVEALSLPKNLKPVRFLQTLIRSLDTGEDLPASYDVAIHWRNPSTRSGRSRFWQDDEFSSAVADSSAGFRTLLRRVLVRQLLKARMR